LNSPAAHDRWLTAAEIAWGLMGDYGLQAVRQTAVSIYTSDIPTG
jgi:hypothetical protein